MTRNTLIINTITSLLNTTKNKLWLAMKNAIIDTELRESRTHEHRDIFQAIAARDESNIITTVQTHLENSKLRFFVEDDTYSPTNIVFLYPYEHIFLVCPTLRHICISFDVAMHLSKANIYL